MFRIVQEKRDNVAVTFFYIKEFMMQEILENLEECFHLFNSNI